MTNKQPTDEEIARAIYAFAAEKMKMGRSNYHVEQALIEKGLLTNRAAPGQPAG